MAGEEGTEEKGNADMGPDCERKRACSAATRQRSCNIFPRPGLRRTATHEWATQDPPHQRPSSKDAQSGQSYPIVASWRRFATAPPMWTASTGGELRASVIVRAMFS